MSQDFDQFDFDDVAVLKMVRMFAHPDLTNGVGLIELIFSEGTVFVAVDASTDNLICSRVLPEVGKACTRLFPTSFWDPIIGKFLTTAWQMTTIVGIRTLFNCGFAIVPMKGRTPSSNCTARHLRLPSVK